MTDAVTATLASRPPLYPSPPMGVGKGRQDPSHSTASTHSTVSALSERTQGPSPATSSAPGSPVSLYALLRGSPPSLSAEAAVEALQRLSLSSGPLGEGSPAAAVSQKVTDSAQGVLPSGMGSRAPHGGAGRSPSPIDMPTPALSVEETAHSSSLAVLPEDLQSQLTYLAREYNGYLHEESSFLVLFLFVILSTDDFNLYNSLALAFVEKNPLKQRVAMTDVFTRARQTLGPRNETNELRFDLYTLGIKLCATGRVNIFYDSLKKHLPPGEERVGFLEKSTVVPELVKRCNAGLSAALFLAHNLFLVHNFSTVFIRAIETTSPIPIPPTSGPLADIFPLKSSLLSRIDTILADHPYFRGFDSLETRRTLYRKVSSFLEKLEDSQRTFYASFVRFLSLTDTVGPSITGLQGLLSRVQGSLFKIPALIEITNKYYGLLLTRRGFWSEHVRWILEQGRSFHRDLIYLLYLDSYLQHPDTIRKWSSGAHPDFVRDIEAYVASGLKPVISSPEALTLLKQLETLTDALQTAEVFLDELDSSFAKAEEGSGRDLTVLKALLQAELLTCTGGRVPSVSIHRHRVTEDPIIVEDSSGRATLIRFTAVTKPTPIASDASAPTEQTPETEEAVAETAASPPAYFSDLFEGDFLRLPSFKTEEARMAFQNAHLYAQDLYTRACSVENVAPLRQEAAHRILDIIRASYFCLEQVLTSCLLEERNAEAPYRKSLSEGRHLGLRERLILSGLVSVLKGESYQTLRATTTSLERVEIATRELPRDFTLHPLLTACHTMLTTEVAPDEIAACLQQARAFGTETLQAYWSVLKASPLFGSHVPNIESVSFPRTHLVVSTDRDSPIISQLRSSIENRYPTTDDLSTAESLTTIFYTLDRLAHLYRDLAHPGTFRFAESHALLTLRDLVEQVLYLQAALLGVRINRSEAGHDLMAIAKKLGLEKSFSREEVAFLESNSQLRNKMRYKAVETSSRSAKKEIAKASSFPAAGAGAPADSLDEGPFALVFNDKQKTMAQRLDGELATASSILDKVMGLKPKPVIAPMGKSSGKKK